MMKNEEISVPYVLMSLYSALVSRYPVPKMKGKLKRYNEELEKLQKKDFFCLMK